MYLYIKIHDEDLCKWINKYADIYNKIENEEGNHLHHVNLTSQLSLETIYPTTGPT